MTHSALAVMFVLVAAWIARAPDSRALRGSAPLAVALAVALLLLQFVFGLPA